MQKFDHYVSNLTVLQGAGEENLTNEFIISGIIDKFYIQFELGWKTLKELLKYEGRIEAKTGSPREIIKAAYDETVWLDMLRERNSTAHIYNETAARELVCHILETYIPAFALMRERIADRYDGKLDEWE